MAAAAEDDNEVGEEQLSPEEPPTPWQRVEAEEHCREEAFRSVLGWLVVTAVVDVTAAAESVETDIGAVQLKPGPDDDTCVEFEGSGDDDKPDNSELSISCESLKGLRDEQLLCRLGS